MGFVADESGYVDLKLKCNNEEAADSGYCPKCLARAYTDATEEEIEKIDLDDPKHYISNW